ncbi:MAG: hypothetical protein O3A00_13570 [Planctomycetota bacterium]|nr:hypothetical protein [Planctomycetota bacterium]
MSGTRNLLLAAFFCVGLHATRLDAQPVVRIDSPMSPPPWAVMQRALLKANTAACQAFFNRYFDERGFLLCVERWGGDDGPDDAIECCNDWPLLHALGADDDVFRMYSKAWEGHLRQFTLAKTVKVPFARDGMYYKEFPVMFDWLHNGEGLTVFNLKGLSDTGSVKFRNRVRRFAGFYMNEDPQAPNYDPKHKIIRSLFNGSRGPLLRKATGLDWAGDPIEVEHRFRLGHGERSYQEMLDHFKDYNDIVGDHPSNLLATTLALNAYMLSGEAKYRKWLLEYVDAWKQRILDNKGIIPTNIGLDGTIGGETNGKWYGGVYGWGFSVVVPQTGALAHRSTFQHGFVGFMNAYMLTGNDEYLEGWRKQFDLVNANKKVVDGKTLYPSKFGDDGWYNYTSTPFNANALDLYNLSMQPADLKWVPKNGWLDYLAGKNPTYPVSAMQADFARVRTQAERQRNDETTPDTRLADDPMLLNPCSVKSLIELMLGGIHPGKRSAVINCRLRYFDPVRRRAGVPEDVAALVDRLTADTVALTLVNTSQTQSRELIIQAGGYGEHTFKRLSLGGKSRTADDRHVRVQLAPGCGARLELGTKRFSNQPTLAFPWQN